MLFRMSFFQNKYIQNMFFFEADTSSEHLVFQKRNFFKGSYFLETVTLSYSLHYQFYGI